MNRIIDEDLHEITTRPLPWKQFFDKTVMVTGANGFIASYVVKTLLYLNRHRKANIRVIALVRNLTKARIRFVDFSDDKKLTFLVADVTKPIRNIGSVDYIVHAASYATPTKYGVDPVGTLLPNILGTYHMLEFAKSQKLTGFLFVSSGEVYGNPSKAMIKIPEDYFGSVDPASVRSCYAESKRMGETMCVSWHAQFNVPAKIVRLFHTYGPGMTLGDGRVHSDFVGNIVNNQNIVMKSDGRAKRPFCYVADTVLGMFTVLLKGNVGEPYNVGSDKPVAVKTLARMLVDLYPEKKLKVITDIIDRGNTYLPSPIRLQKPDLTKLRSLGWKPTYDSLEGFQRTIESYII